MNEVLLSANLAAVKGIVVSEDAHDESIDNAQDYVRAVHEAVELRDWLYKHPEYKKQFPVGSLPIVSYNPHRRGAQLLALNEEQIMKPELPGAVSFRG